MKTKNPMKGSHSAYFRAIYKNNGFRVEFHYSLGILKP